MSTMGKIIRRSRRGGSMTRPVFMRNRVGRLVVVIVGDILGQQAAIEERLDAIGYRRDRGLGFIKQQRTTRVLVAFRAAREVQGAVTRQRGIVLVERGVASQRAVWGGNRECAGQNESNRVALFVVNFPNGVSLTRHGPVEDVA